MAVRCYFLSLVSSLGLICLPTLGKGRSDRFRPSGWAFRRKYKKKCSLLCHLLLSRDTELVSGRVTVLQFGEDLIKESKVFPWLVKV